MGIVQMVVKDGGQDMMGGAIQVQLFNVLSNSFKNV